MDSLKQIVREEVSKYAGSGRGANTLLFPLLDDAHATYAVVGTDEAPRQYKALIAVFARLQDTLVIIEEDNTDKPLVDALEQRGVPRSQIVLAYLGESISDADVPSVQ